MKTRGSRISENFQPSGSLRFDANGECHDRHGIADVWMSVCKYPNDDETRVLDGTTYLHCVALTDDWSSSFWAVYPGNDNPRDAEKHLPEYLVKQLPATETRTIKSLTENQLMKIVVESLADVLYKDFLDFLEHDGKEYKENVERIMSSHGFTDISIVYKDEKGRVILTALDKDGKEITILPEYTKFVTVSYPDGAQDYGMRLKAEFGGEDYTDLVTALSLICMIWKDMLEDRRYREVKRMRRHRSLPDGKHYIQNGKWKKIVY